MSGNQTVFQEAMNQGHSAAWDQDWEKAAQYYRNALTEFPKNTMALNNLGLALFELKKYDQALECYTKAATVSPEDPLAPEKMARIYERLGQLTEAINASIHAAELYLKTRDVDKTIENYRKVTLLNPEHINARKRLGGIYERLGRKEEAVEEILAAASIMQRSGNPDQAAQLVDHCLKLLPDSKKAQEAKTLLQKRLPLPQPMQASEQTASFRMAEIRQMQSVSELKGKKTPGTTQSYQTPVAAAKQTALVQLASLLFDQTDESQDTVSSPRSAAKQEKILLHLGQAIDAQTHNQDAQAIEDLEATLSQGLEHPSIYFNLGLLTLNKKPKDALKYLHKSINSGDYALASYILLGRIYLKVKNYKDAATAYLNALWLADAETLSKKHTGSLRKLYEPIIESNIHQSDNEALQSLCKTIASYLDRPDWLDYLKMARSQLPPQPEGSPPLPLSEMLLESKGSQMIDSIAFIQKLAEEGKLGSAKEEAFYALQYAPTYLPLHTQIGELLVQEGLIAAAVEKFTVVAKLYNLRGETAQAINLLRNVINISPMSLDVRAFLIDLLINQNRIDEAIEESINLAKSYEYLADLDKMRKVLTNTLKLAQEKKADRNWTVKILFAIADIDMQRLDLHPAIRIFEQIRTMKPEDAEARAKLVDLNFRLKQDKFALNEVESFTTFLENARKLNQAIEFNKNLIESYPYKIELRQALAELYARNNMIEEAVEQLDFIVNINISAKDIPATISTLERIIVLNPPNLADYRAALAKMKNQI